MTERRTELQAALTDALVRAKQSLAQASSPAAREKLQQLIVSVEQALIDLGAHRETQVLGLTKWVADWIPNVDDPLIAALDKVEQAAIEGV